MSTALDEGILDSEQRLAAVDRAGLLRSLATAGAQVRESMALAGEVDLPAALAGLRPRAVLVAADPSSAARLTRARGPAAVLRSTGTKDTRPPGCKASRSGPGERAPATTWTPSATRAAVMARPMPLLAPVTMAIFPLSWRSMAARLPVAVR